MTPPTAPEPRRSNARANRARILAVAQVELSRNPDATLEDVARATGVVRRTVFGHFPGRPALLEAVAQEVSQVLGEAVRTSVSPDDPPERALARFVLGIWPVGDRYRMLIGLARRDLGHERVSELLAPAREKVTSILERGQALGAIPAHVPPRVLSAALEAMALSLIESVGAEAWHDDGTATATATLIAAGVPARRAEAEVHDLAALLSRTGKAAGAPESAETG
ncbi:TetR/AcrR family transcriptional regulator [Streptomyces liangshanensis]|uniref:TetR/AcrR family transcriptional regulator n=1 Tax=Streptomyces liangshanensis TaxID=2717324 RepID=A0A6G9H7U2_9ACTN|nr:TetR family transcriptional regulator [Streptomyces liangshanensis]QIQ06376.1 TetR/AcrR family transcriptional regulator [Streptomyces liangshanensis]